MGTQIDTLNQLIQAREEARAVLAEMHGLLKDLRQERADIKDLLSKGAVNLVMASINANLEVQIPKMMGDLREDLNYATERLERKWNKEFASLCDLSEKARKLMEEVADR